MRAVFEPPPIFLALRAELVDVPTRERLAHRPPSTPAPRFLLLYVLLRERSFSRLPRFEAHRVVGVMEELVKFTLLTRDASLYLVNRHSKRKDTTEALSARVNQRAT